jgi:transposase
MARKRIFYRYADHFKATAVKLSQLEGVLIKDVAEALDIHPFMLSRWRKHYREGLIMAKGKKVSIDQGTAAELKRLRKLERDHKLLIQEHELLKKAIRFSSKQKKKSSSL